MVTCPHVGVIGPVRIRRAAPRAKHAGKAAALALSRRGRASSAGAAVASAASERLTTARRALRAINGPADRERAEEAAVVVEALSIVDGDGLAGADPVALEGDLAWLSRSPQWPGSIPWSAFPKTRRLWGAIPVEISVEMLWTSAAFLRSADWPDRATAIRRAAGYGRCEAVASRDDRSRGWRRQADARDRDGSPGDPVGVRRVRGAVVENRRPRQETGRPSLTLWRPASQVCRSRQPRKPVTRGVPQRGKQFRCASRARYACRAGRDRKAGAERLNASRAADVDHKRGRCQDCRLKQRRTRL